jgi:hypothetical protein
MKHVLLKLVLRFRPSQGRAIFAVCLAGIMSALCALPCYSQSPTITSISNISIEQFQTIVINGSGFGHQAPYTGDSSYIALDDETKGWQAGYSGFNDTVTLIVNKWEDSKIVLGGFSGAWGQFNYTLAIGDKEQVEVWNAQSGAGPATKTVRVRGAATTTALTSLPSAYGQPVTFTAVVSSDDGTPPDGETVTFMQGTTVLGTGTLSGGSASFTTMTRTAEAGAITAVYGGDADFDGSTSKAVKQVVDSAAN